MSKLILVRPGDWVTDQITGIVTKMGIHMSPAPEAYTRIMIGVPEEADLVPLVGGMTDLMRRRVFVNPPQLFDRPSIVLGALPKDPRVAATLGSYCSLEHHIPDELIEKAAIMLGLPAWSAAFALYGPPEAQPGLIEAVKRRFAQIEGVKITTETFTAAPGEYLRGEDVTPDYLPQNGVPGLEMAKAFSARDDSGWWHNCYSPVLPPSGRELYEWYLGAKKITAEHDLTFIADFHVFDRYIISINLVMFHPAAKARLPDVQFALMEYSKGLGYLEYRTHVSFMDATAASQTFNDGAFGRFTTLLKDVIDPNGVFAPGKSGIWNSNVKR